MRCSSAQAAISASMDGETLSLGARTHVEGCEACRAFAEVAQEIRVAARLGVAEEVPDLVGRIMSRVREEAPAFAGAPSRVGALRQTWRANKRALLAAAMVGVIVGAAITWPGVMPSRNAPGALAAGIPHEIADAASGLSAFEARYLVTELTGGNQDAKFDVSVAFSSPERYRVDVRSSTGGGIPNNSTLTVDGARWSLSGSQACVTAVTTPCPASGLAPASTRTVSGRPPFDPDSPMPTDIILPVTSLAGSSNIDVIGEGTVAGRAAVEIGLSAQDASPLFEFFQQSGSWTPMYPSDRVSLWLDRASWFPLSYSVTSVGGQDRAIWSQRNGLPVEKAGVDVLDVRLASFSLTAPDAARFAVSGVGHDEGFRDLPLAQMASAVGFAPVQPTDLSGLTAYRSGYFQGQPGEALLSYSAGLTWLRLRETRSWRSDSLFGNVDAFAQKVALPGGGVGYVEAAGNGVGRRVAIHASGMDLLLESNLPPDTLLEIAGSIPVRGLEIPAAWRVQHPAPGVTVEQMSASDLVSRAGFVVLQPATLPPGYQLSSAELTTIGGNNSASLLYSRAGFDAGGIRVYQAPGDAIPPAAGTDLVAVGVRGTTGRWSPLQHQLEWVENGVYRSITAPGLGLSQILSLASSLGGSS